MARRAIFVDGGVFDDGVAPVVIFKVKSSNATATQTLSLLGWRIRRT